MSITIENAESVTVHFSDQGSPLAKAFIASLFRETPPEDSPKDIPPSIGEAWVGQGGIYCGVARGEDGQPDHHLILAAEAPEQDFAWEAAREHAKTVTADGHQDFALPTRFESALLYANVRDKLDTGHWHWTGTQSSEYDAFLQHFDYGYQYDGSKKFEGRARFVRRTSVL